MCTASLLNLGSSRAQELKEGTALYDPETGKAMPDCKSTVAARQAFWQSALTRVLIPAPTFVIPIGVQTLMRNKVQLYNKSKVF